MAITESDAIDYTYKMFMKIYMTDIYGTIDSSVVAAANAKALGFDLSGNLLDQYIDIVLLEQANGTFTDSQKTWIKDNFITPRINKGYTVDLLKHDIITFGITSMKNYIINNTAKDQINIIDFGTDELAVCNSKLLDSA